MSDYPQFSKLAQGFTGSSILQMALRVQQLQSEGKTVYNFTVGDYNPKEFGIPSDLRDLVLNYYRQGMTNYPPLHGELSLRKSIAEMYRRDLGLNYNYQEVVIGGGGRAAIFAAFITLVNPGETVFFGVPCWNYNYYTQIVGGVAYEVKTTPENNFLPTAADLLPVISKTALVVLCSPNNPTGTIYSEQALRDICQVIMNENRKRVVAGRKPCYILYDQIYWRLCFAGNEHYHPVGLIPELKNYVIYADGLSKAYAATGLRVGWGVGPAPIMQKIADYIGFCGAWAPKPEQLAAADYFKEADKQALFFNQLNEKLHSRLALIQEGMKQMQVQTGLPIEVIEPQGALYLSIRLGFIGYRTPDGYWLTDNAGLRDYLLNEAGCALIPFSDMDAPHTEGWFRASVGGISLDEIPKALQKMQQALTALQPPKSI